MRTIQAVLYQRNKKDSAGIIKIRVTENRKPIYVSTEQKVLARHWDDKHSKVKETDEVDYEYINKVVAAKLAEVKAQYEENAVASKASSFVGFFEKFIERQTNEGTKIKYGVILSKVKSYLKEKKKDDLRFKEITEDLVYSMRRYFYLSMEADTADHYLKVVKSVIGKAVKANVHNYIRNPFAGIELKAAVTKTPSSLTAEQLQQIINADIQDRRVATHRSAFLFQLFAQGMRISDLLVLRWNNFQDGRLEYKMIKTGRQMSILLNDNLVEILRPMVEPVSRLGESARETIERLSSKKDSRNRFVFPFLDDEEFAAVDHRNDFSRIGKALYVRLNKKSIVYNRNLKDVQKAAGIKTNITSHTARHSYASLLLDGDVNLYAISQSLGHSTLLITQKYLSNFRTKKLDDVNDALVGRFPLGSSRAQSPSL
ncbi:site-specific integrase [Rufibacter ruber]|uniref:site-specific integrase n=1 Tax=Rufibacter ruber TaxID=1783499 RepID=UPI00083042B7|nr:site-specific integrase [Rufibacter ruber]